MGLISHVKKIFKGEEIGRGEIFFLPHEKKVGNQGVSQCCGGAVRPSAGCEGREKFFSLFPVFLGALLWETDLAERGWLVQKVSLFFLVRVSSHC